MVRAGGGAVASQVFGALEHGFIQLNESDVFNGVLGAIESHWPEIGRTGLLKHAAVGGRAIAIKAGGVAGLKRIDRVKHPLDPTHGQLRQESPASIRLRLRRIRGPRPLIGHGSGRSAAPVRHRCVRRDQPPSRILHRRVGHAILTVSSFKFLLETVAHVKKVVRQ